MARPDMKHVMLLREDKSFRTLFHFKISVRFSTSLIHHLDHIPLIILSQIWLKNSLIQKLTYVKILARSKLWKKNESQYLFFDWELAKP